MQKPGLFGMNGFIVFLFTCLSFAARAQQPGYLILIDAENKQAFIVRIGDQLYSSSSHGHLVLSQLKDSTYRINLRFPKKNIAEQIFPVSVHQKDLGFQIKGTDSSCVLYNWQTRETIRPLFEKDSSRILEQGVKRDDGFSKLMAAVVNDTAVMYNTYSGNGFNRDSSMVTGHLPTLANGQPSTANRQPLASNIQLPATEPAGGSREKLSNDSLLASKTATGDSLIAAKKRQAFLKDSLNSARKSALKDSMIAVKKQQGHLKDSLLAVRKALKDSLLSAKKSGGSQDSLMTAQKTQESKDSLLAANKANANRDSLLAVSKANFLKDSLASVSSKRLPAIGHRSSLAPEVKKLREVSLKISRKIVFLDIGKDGIIDTITLFVYFETADTSFKKQSGGAPLVLKKPTPPDSMGVKKSQLQNKNSDLTGLNKGLARNKNSDTARLNNSLARKSSLKPGETDCGQAATDADTEFLRSAILKANSEQEKISVANDAFALKCFSVSQVRLLVSLLVSDKARYRLMDAAHYHIADPDHFTELVDMLTDKNFQRKFLLMAEKRS